MDAVNSKSTQSEVKIQSEIILSQEQIPESVNTSQEEDISTNNQSKDGTDSKYKNVQTCHFKSIF